MAAVLLSGRDDWHPRIAYFAMFGALGWSFGGSISYMQVVGYTHSGHSPSVLYGFACLFVIGFLWAALGGAGTALPALVGRSFLEDLLVTTGCVFFFWWLQGVAIETLLIRAGFSLNWYDTDWLAATLAVAAALVVWGIRRRLNPATSLVLHLAVGWWAGFLLLVLVSGLHMTPPRGDNWSGCLGMTAGLLWYCRTAHMPELARTALICGFAGGIGFAAVVHAQAGRDHQRLPDELAQHTRADDGPVQRRRPRLRCRRPGEEGADDRGRHPRSRLGRSGRDRLRRPGNHLSQPEEECQLLDRREGRTVGHGRHADLGLVRPGLSPARIDAAGALGPGDERTAHHPACELAGQGQVLYLWLLWSVVIGNFERELVVFTARKLVTEGVLYVVALACTIVLLLAPTVRRPSRVPTSPIDVRDRPGFVAIVVMGLAIAMATIVGDWAIVRAVHGDHYAGPDYAALNIRFGPNATTKRPK